ncbi:MAG: hypothetical protein KKD38_08175 [Candidatus Delongbacteria bacterium]|nr:hypothetical protein [Candidatus Delongbacteria bacterium]
MKFDYPETKKCQVVENIHGVEIKDDYRWMEDNKDPEVLAWDEAQNEFTDKYISQIPFRNKLKDRLLEFMKVDEVNIPEKVLNGERILQYKKKADDEKWVLFTRKDENSPEKELLNPNKWPEDETLAYFQASRDGKYIAYGISKGGNEAPVLKVMEIIPITQF